MRIGFIGNQNNYPFMLARGLRRLGHDVRVVIDRPEPLDRPESRYADITRPYPDWIVETPPIGPIDVAFDTPTWRAALDAVQDCDALVLNGLAFGAASLLPLPAVCLSTGSDVEFWSNVEAADTYIRHAEAQSRDCRWIQRALNLLAWDGLAVRDLLENTPAPLFRVWRKHVFRRLVSRQQSGLRRAVAISALPDAVSQPLEEIVRDCLAPGASRLCLFMADVSWVNRVPQPNNTTLRLFNASRILWHKPFPPIIGEWENKGTDVLIRGVALWRRRSGRAIDLRLAEKGPSVEATKALVRELDLETCVTWRPEMSQREVFEEYARADVVVEQLGTHVLGMAAYEAMAAGRPVLANGRPEILTDVFGCSVPVAQARAPEEVADQLDRLSMPGERERLGALGRRFVEAHLDPDRVAATVAAIFEKAVARQLAAA